MKKKKSFSYEGAGLDREHLPQLGLFFLIAFGVPFVVMEFFTSGSLFPTWPIWYFRVGFALGVLVLLISFFIKSKKKDVKEEPKKMTSDDQKEDFPRPSEKSFPSKNQNQK